jgi:SAM-dependent methyltransferase
VAGAASDPDWATVFGEAFSQPASAVMARVWATVLGDEYPAEVSPYSYTSRSELARIATEVKAGSGDLLVDIGSGRGGPGLWVAAATGAHYLAVDISATGLADRVRVAEGSFEELPLADSEVSAVMSIDALLFTPNKGAATHELARVLQPGGRLVLTTWDYRSQPIGRPPQVADHRPLLEEAGLRVLAYEETPDWEARQRGIDRLLMEAVVDLAAEQGEPVEQVRHDLAEMAAALDHIIRRVLIVAERRS